MPTEIPSTTPLAEPRRGRSRAWRLAVGLAALLPAAGVATVLVARQEPAFYARVAQAGAEQAAVGADAEVLEGMRQRASARFVSTLAALASDVAQPGAWSTVLGDEEVNAWLAVELPVNHPELVPPGVADLRVRFTPGAILLGCRMGGPLAAVAWVDVQVRLLEANRLAITVQQCRMGLLPLPTGLAASRLAESLTRSGLRCEVQRIAGQTQLVVQLPATEIRGDQGVAVSWWLDGLRLEDGDVFLTGTSRRVRESRHGNGS